jgi:hypothetical protein
VAPFVSHLTCRDMGMSYICIRYDGGHRLHRARDLLQLPTIAHVVAEFVPPVLVRCIVYGVRSVGESGVVVMLATLMCNSLDG